MVQGEGELQRADVEHYEQGQVESGWARSQGAGRLSLFWEKVRQDDVKLRSHCYEKVGKMQDRDQRLLPARGRLSLERTEGESMGDRVALRQSGQWRPQDWRAGPRQLPWLPSGSQAVQSVATGGGTQEVQLPSPQPAGGCPGLEGVSR